MNTQPSQTLTAGPNAEALHRRALVTLPGGNTRTTVFVPPQPPYARRAEGAYLTDVDGHTVLDLLNNYTCLVHGHARREIVAEAAAAIHDGSCFGLPTEHEIELAERLAHRLPSAPKWRFVNSGSEAVMMAIRLARAVTGKGGIVRFQDAFHGTYDAAVQTPARGVPESVAGEIITVAEGDGEGLAAILESQGNRIACVLFDAMPHRAGGKPADGAFVQLVREQTRRNDVLLIHDEVITFRLAEGGIQSLYGLEPDITTVGKIIGGGFPIGAFGGRAELMDVFDPARTDSISHTGTFNANPVSMRAGAVSLDLLPQSEIDRINTLGERLYDGLLALGWEVVGQGSLLRVHSSDPTALWWALYEEGILIGGNGVACVSTAMANNDIDRALESFARVRDKWEDGPG